MFNYDNVNVNYEYINNKSKNTLVFLHGWGQNIQMMLPIANAFTKDNNVLVVDLPGHGKSTEPEYPWELEHFVDMLHELFESLKIKEPILIGHSFGGKLSMIYASKFKVKKLVLLSSPYKGEYKKIPLKVKVLKALAKVPGLKGIANYFKKHMGSTDYKNASPIMRGILVKHVNYNAEDNLKKIDVPTIVIWGTNDTTVKIEQAYEIEKLVKDCAVIPYEGLGHFAYFDNPNQTINIIKSFIG